MDGIRIGIDFGTCYSNVGYRDQLGMHFVQDPAAPQRSDSIPSSALLRADNSFVFGVLAESEKNAAPEGYQREFKRDLGSSAPYLLRDKKILPADLTAEFLGFLVGLTEQKLGEKPTGAVITIPAAYDQYRRPLVEDAARHAGLAGAWLMAEPVAAVIGAAERGEITDHGTTLVYDLGGGTFDAAVVRLDGGTQQVLGDKGLPDFGGTDIDVLIERDFAAKAGDEFAAILAGLDSGDPKRVARAMRTRTAAQDFCRNIKHRLSSTDHVADVLSVDFGYELSRLELEDMVRPHLDRTVSTCRELLASTALTPEQIDTVLLVGGGSYMPLVREVLARELGRPVKRAADPELAVCTGAAILARTSPQQATARQAQEQTSQAAQAPVPPSHLARTLTGHSDAINRVAFSPDGHLLATSSADKTARLWDPATGGHLRSLTGHDGKVFGVAFSPDGRLLATASIDRTARLWDPATGGHLRTLTGHDGVVNEVAFSPDGHLLATASAVPDHTVRLWDPATGGHLRTLTGHDGTVFGVAFSPDGRLLATASIDRTARLWDPATGKHLRTLTGHSDAINRVAFSPDGRLLATTSDDRTVRLWDPATGGHLRTLTGHDGGVFGVAFSPDGCLLATVGEDRTVRLWDSAAADSYGVATTAREQTSLAPARQQAERQAEKPHQPRITVGQDPSGRAVSKRADSQPAQLSPVRLTTITAPAAANAVAFSPDATHVAVGCDQGLVLITDLAGQEQLRIRHAWPGSEVDDIAYDSDGHRLATCGFYQTARIWDASTGRRLRMIQTQATRVFGVAFSPDGTRLATAGLDKTARIWDANTRHELRKFTHNWWVHGVAFSPDGNRLATASYDRTAKIWDVSTGRELMTVTYYSPDTNYVLGVAFSPDGTRLATGSRVSPAMIWDASTGRQILKISDTAGVTRVAFSPDGTMLGTASGDKTAKIWDANNGRELFRVTHTDPVKAVAFSQDGSMFATASRDKTVQLWRLKKRGDS